MKQRPTRNPFWALVFLGYSALMLYLLFFRNRTITDEIPYWEQVKSNYNLSLGHTISSFWDILERPEYYMDKWQSASVYRAHAATAVVNLVGNVVMFIPFGAFLPAMWQGLQKVWKTVGAGFLWVLCVELLQLMTLLGKCDVDDVLLNMLGITAGYCVWRIHKSHRKK